RTQNLALLLMIGVRIYFVGSVLDRRKALAHISAQKRQESSAPARFSFEGCHISKVRPALSGAGPTNILKVLPCSPAPLRRLPPSGIIERCGFAGERTPMEITDIRIKRVESENKLKAYVTI